MPLPLFARTIRGIEWVAAAEISAIARVTELAHREVHFEIDELTPAILELGSVDDAFLTVGGVNEIGHTRAALDLLAHAARNVDLAGAAETLNELRQLPPTPVIEVVAS